MRFFIALLLLAIGTIGAAQQNLMIKITGDESATPVAANILIRETKQNVAADSSGIVVISFSSNGQYILVFSAVGHHEKQIKINIPYTSDTLFAELGVNEEELEEVIVQSTRTSRTIANVPTRVETIELEEIDEKINMRPSNIAMLLHESTGIQIQQTSATSASASIRIQGLDGRYTQLLKDGFANFGNFSSGLSVLEIPPLDLKQVEIIKGPASPLFGGGAIAGVINFISKIPSSNPEYSFILNQSNIGQTNIGGFASARGRKIGYTMLALYNRQKEYDVDKDDFTELPRLNEYTLHPKIFIYLNESTIISLGNSFTKSDRTGGDVFVIEKGADASHQYFERNKTLRNISTFQLDKRIDERKQFVLKQSVSVFDRSINIPAYNFAGIDYNAYTDVSYLSGGEKHSFVAGGNFVYNRFREKYNGNNNRNNTIRTGGLYSQHTWDASETIKLESGLRVDVTNYSNNLYSNTEWFILPRVSLLIRYNSQWTSRIGAGMGYKTQTLFTEETETIQYRNVDQLSNVKSEKSYGGTADVNLRTYIADDLAFTFNHMFFFTQIKKPLVLENYSANNYRFVNATKPVQSAGFEINARFIFKDHLKLFLGYTFTHTKARYLTDNQFLPLVPKNKLNSALIYEKEGVIKMGLEGYFTGRQYLSNGNRTPANSEYGFMVEKIFSKFSLYINFENFTDTRQGRFKNVVNGSHLSPSFDEIWTHTEGFVINGGIKIRL